MSRQHSTAHHGPNPWPLAPLSAPMSHRAHRLCLGLALVALVVVLVALAPLAGA